MAFNRAWLLVSGYSFGNTMAAAWKSWKSIRDQEPWRQPEIAEVDFAWLAGLLEGEGCFSLQSYRKHPAEKIGGYQVPSIELKMTDRDVVQRAGKLLGGKQGRVRSQLRKEHGKDRKPIFIWRVNGHRAVYLMSLLLPFMGKRRSSRIRELITLHKRQGPRGGHGITPSLRFSHVTTSRNEFNAKRRAKRRAKTARSRQRDA